MIGGSSPGRGREFFLDIVGLSAKLLKRSTSKLNLSGSSKHICMHACMHAGSKIIPVTSLPHLVQLHYKSFRSTHNSDTPLQLNIPAIRVMVSCQSWFFSQYLAAFILKQKKHLHYSSGILLMMQWISNEKFSIFRQNKSHWQTYKL
jgi:hypothetical protein